MTYTPAESFQLFVSFLGKIPLAFDPRQLPVVLEPIMLALLETYLIDPYDISARVSTFENTFDQLTPQEARTFEACLEEGSIEHNAIHIPLTHQQKAVIRALFNIAPEQNGEIADYLLDDPGNTHRRLQSLVKKELVLRTIHNSKIYYHLSPKHFLVKNPFPDPFANLNTQQLLAELTAEAETIPAPQP